MRSRVTASPRARVTAFEGGRVAASRRTAPRARRSNEADAASPPSRNRHDLRTTIPAGWRVAKTYPLGENAKRDGSAVTAIPQSGSPARDDQRLLPQRAMGSSAKKCGSEATASLPQMVEGLLPRLLPYGNVWTNGRLLLA